MGSAPPRPGRAPGAKVTDPATLQRSKDLAIPPAWQAGWVCPHPNGHLQAVGTDAAGRKQYLYHAGPAPSIWRPQAA